MLQNNTELAFTFHLAKMLRLRRECIEITNYLASLNRNTKGKQAILEMSMKLMHFSGIYINSYTVPYNQSSP